MMLNKYRATVIAALVALSASWCQPADVRAEAAEAEHAAGSHGHDDLGHGNAGANLENMTEVKTDLAIYTLVVFLLLVTVLGIWVWPKISEAMLERERRIEESLTAAEAKQEEAKRLLSQHEAKLASAAAEVRAMLEEARRDAEQARNEIIAEAHNAAQADRERALREIDTAKDHAMKDIAETSANLAVELAGKVIRDTINPAKQQELVRSALSKLSASSN